MDDAAHTAPPAYGDNDLVELFLTRDYQDLLHRVITWLRGS